jgi:hypothetical protein
MSERGIFGLKPDLRLERRSQGGQDETQKPDHSASLGDSVTSSNTDRVFGTHTSRRGYTNEKNAIQIAEAIAALGFGGAVKDSGTQDDR